MSLEQEIRQDIFRALQSTPVGVEAIVEGFADSADPVQDLVVPWLQAQQEAIFKIARKVDEATGT